MAQTATPPVDLGSYLTVTEVATALRTDRGTVYRHVRAGRLAAVRFGGAIRIPVDALEEFLAPAADSRGTA